ncbi:hypothetical protein F4859DRAFT_205509 [Xylaria cf. heliscus]|nr:hypothetical protein F4859DRAFT_205509 [Xylaria cf. heliscus]
MLLSWLAGWLAGCLAVTTPDPRRPPVYSVLQTAVTYHKPAHSPTSAIRLQTDFLSQAGVSSSIYRTILQTIPRSTCAFLHRPSPLRVQLLQLLQYRVQSYTYLSYPILSILSIPSSFEDIPFAEQAPAFRSLNPVPRAAVGRQPKIRTIGFIPPPGRLDPPPTLSIPSTVNRQPPTVNRRLRLPSHLLYCLHYTTLHYTTLHYTAPPQHTVPPVR